MEEILYLFNPWWTKKFDPPGIPREKYLFRLMALKDTKDVILITGLRRVGKTTLMHQIISQLLKTVEAKKIFYVSMDHLALKDHSLLGIVDGFRRAQGLEQDEFVYLFLDEVHMKEDYELALKNLYDMGHAKVYASGSSSLDIIMRSPALTGRQRIIRMSPLSFTEYLDFTNKNISPANSHLYPQRAEEYVMTGGMPEYVNTGDMNVLDSLIYSILYRDISERNNIRNRKHLEDGLILIAQSVGSPTSLRKISRVLGIPFNTISRILTLFIEANLVHSVEKQGKVSERKASPNKIYLADNGLFLALTENINKGAMVENLVYLALKEKGTVRYHRANNKEVDFIIGKQAWEVKYKNKVDPKDISNLTDLRGFSKKTLITYDASGKMDGVTLVPLWKFLLEEDNY